MQKRWTVKKHDYKLIKELSKALNVSPIVAAILTSRGYDTEETASKFLHPKPFL